MCYYVCKYAQPSGDNKLSPERSVDYVAHIDQCQPDSRITHTASRPGRGEQNKYSNILFQSFAANIFALSKQYIP